MSELRPDDTPENPFWYTFKVQCTSCREIHPNHVNVSRFVSEESKGNVRETQANLSIGGKRDERQQRRGKLCLEMQVLQGQPLTVHTYEILGADIIKERIIRNYQGTSNSV